MSGEGKPRLVLVVDDDEMIRRLVRAVLEADEFEVAEARDGQAALALASETRPSVVVLDIMMPGLDGVEVCRRLDHDQVRVVILTARDDPKLETEAREAGADAFMTKPFAPMELLDLVGELMNK
ncbi:MAG TPA: response regulator [Acidimicrobiales bacterium]|nr:response regulator [Acidimicrobiales bacterium]